MVQIDDPQVYALFELSVTKRNAMDNQRHPRRI